LGDLSEERVDGAPDDVKEQQNGNRRRKRRAYVLKGEGATVLAAPLPLPPLSDDVVSGDGVIWPPNKPSWRCSRRQTIKQCTLRRSGRYRRAPFL